MGALLLNADTGVRLAVWLVLILTGGTYLWRARRVAPSMAVLILAVFALALAVRLLLPPWAPLHPDQHGIDDIRNLLDYRPITSRHGFGYAQFVRVALRLIGSSSDHAILVAAISGSLASACLLLAGARLTGGLAGGLVAAVGFALDPSLARLSTSESPWSFGLALFLISWLAGAALFADTGGDERKKRLLAWVWACALALACEVHIETLVLVVDSFLLLWALNPRWEAWTSNRRFLAAPIAVLALKFILHILVVRGEGSHQLILFSTFGFPPSETSDLLSYPSLSPVLLLPLALLGALLTEGWRVQAALAVSTLSVVIPAMNVNVSRTDFIRYQAASHLFLYMLASLVMVTLRPRRMIAAAAVIGFWILNAAFWLPSTRTRNADDVGFEIAQRAAKSIPSDATVILPEPFDTSSCTGVEFPEYFFPNHGTGLRLIHGSQVAAGQLPAEVRLDKCFVYLGSGCYRFRGAGTEKLPVGSDPASTIAGAPVNSACVPLLQHADLRNLETQPLVAQTRPAWRNDEYMSLPGRLLTMGFVPCR